jgi:hypothetical protein
MIIVLKHLLQVGSCYIIGFTRRYTMTTPVVAAASAVRAIGLR